MHPALRCLALLVLIVAGGCAPRQQPMVFHFGSPWTSATVDGETGYFLLDTGASVTVMDSELVERTGARQVGSQSVIATTGHVELPTVEAGRIDVAGRRHENRLVSVQDFSLFRAPGGRRQMGLIGSDFFLEYTLAFDMERSRVALSRRPAPLAPGMLPHSMRLNNGLPEIQVLFGDDQVPLWCKLDTGSGYATEDSVYLDVSPDVARRLLGDRLLEEPEETVRIVSLAGRTELPIHVYGPVRILGRDFPEVRLVVHEHGDGAFSNPDMVLVTGSVLRQFQRVELDYPGRAVWVR